MATQAVKKKSNPLGGLASFKKSHAFSYNNADKPLEWIQMPPAFQEATRLVGIPMGYVTAILGHSNTGKTTLICHIIAQAQKQGCIPVIIDTENAFDFNYAISMGFVATPVRDDDGKIVMYDGDFLYYNNAILAAQYGDIDYSTGKKVATPRTCAVIEDVAQCINDVLDAQESGQLDAPLLFVWDSIGSIGSWQEYASGKKANNMWQAAAIATSMRDILDNRIPGSKKAMSTYSNTFVMIQKLSVETTPTGLKSAKGKGGLQLHYSARLELFLGGVGGAGTKVLSAVSKGAQIDYATETKIKITKSHLPSPFNVTGEGKFVCTSKGIIKCSELESYKKEHLKEIIDGLNQQLSAYGEGTVDSDNIDFAEREVEE